MISTLRRVWERAVKSSPRGLHFERPLLLFQSDDWGRVGVRDRDGWNELQASGVHLGDAPYDFYSLETAGDVGALRELLWKHRDSIGRHPCMTMNFMMANLDFANCLTPCEKELPLIPLSRGLPYPWQRPQLFEAYREGIQEGVFSAGLHGLTHFCEQAVLRELGKKGERVGLIYKMWNAHTPYIFWRMPWVGYEYWDRELDADLRFLTLDLQRTRIHRAAGVFTQLFTEVPFSACAPGYRSNADTKTAWFESGVRVVQNGPGESKRPFLDERGMLNTFRTIEIEPAITNCDPNQLLKQVAECFRNRIPAVISIHSINFHSTLRDFRTPTIALLDNLLTEIEKQWPDLLYINDGDLFRIATEGFYVAGETKVSVGATMEAKN